VPLSLDSQSPFPLYYQIREQLRGLILSGLLKPGDVLPTETQICHETGVSRMTVRQALMQLANEGLVVRQRGRGTFVAAPKSTLDSTQFPLQGYTEMLKQIGLQAGAKVLAQVIEPATEPVAARLMLNSGDPVVRITRLRLVHNEVMSLETSYYPQNRCPDLTSLDLTNHSIYRLIEERYALVPAYATDTIELSVASPYEAKALSISEGMPVVLVTRLSFLADNTPIEFTQTIHRGDRFKSIVHRSRPQLN
jgi:GntR family transcriptional regulator